ERERVLSSEGMSAVLSVWPLEPDIKKGHLTSSRHQATTHTHTYTHSLSRSLPPARTHTRTHALTQNYFFKSTNHTKRFFSHNNTLTHSLYIQIFIDTYILLHTNMNENTHSHTLCLSLSLPHTHTRSNKLTVKAEYNAVVKLAK